MYSNLNHDSAGSNSYPRQTDSLCFYEESPIFARTHWHPSNKINKQNSYTVQLFILIGLSE